MLNKQKEWLKEKGRNGKEFIKEHKFEVGYFTGVLAVGAVSIAHNKLFGPKKGRIEYCHDVVDNTVRADVIDIDRFGKEKTLRSIKWCDPDDLKCIADGLSEIVYPGD